MITYLANPVRFQRFARYASPILGGLAIIALLVGLYLSLIASPAERDQGDAVRIMYVHVPAVWTAMAAYAAMAISSLIAYIWRHPLADELARSFALPGAAFTALGLLTGGIWGKTSWGTFWQWDGRMTSTLILLFLFIGYMAVWAAIEDKRRAARIAGLVAMVGSINLPIIKYSVDWWNSLHQSASVSSIDAPGMPFSMLLPLLLMGIGYSFFLGWIVLSRMLSKVDEAQNRRRPRAKSKASMEAL